MPETQVTPADIVAFWRDAGPDRWYTPDDAFDGAVRHLACLGIAGIGPGIAAEHVAGKLVEHDDERQRAVIARLP